MNIDFIFDWIIKYFQDMRNFILLHIFGGMRFLTISYKCPLRDDCKDSIKVGILTGKNSFDIETIIGLSFKALAHHLYKKHNVNFFEGLEFKTENGKYTVYGEAPKYPNKHLSKYEKE